MRWRSALAALLLPVAAFAARPGVPMALPEPVALPSLDTQQVSAALIAALTAKKWVVESDDGTAITARIRVRVHSLRLRLAYSTTRVSYAYVDSENYAYEVIDGVPHIHVRANQLIARLDDEVRLQLQPLRFKRDGVEIVPAS